MYKTSRGQETATNPSNNIGVIKPCVSTPSGAMNSRLWRIGCWWSWIMWRLLHLPSPDKSAQYSVAFQNKSLSLSPCPGWPTSACPTVERTRFTCLFSAESPRWQPDANLILELRPLVVPHHGWLFDTHVGDFGGYLGDRRSWCSWSKKADGLINGGISLLGLNRFIE